MFCPNCGKEQVSNPTKCENCGIDIAQILSTQQEKEYADTVNYAGFWRRFAAYIIDGILFNIVFRLIYFAFGFDFSFWGWGTHENTSFIALQFLSILGIIISWLYDAIMESSPWQATLGKMALGIIVTDTKGNRISFGRATGRFFAKIISAMILCIGFIMIAFTQKKQGLHDILAETLVVRK